MYTQSGIAAARGALSRNHSTTVIFITVSICLRCAILCEMPICEVVSRGVHGAKYKCRGGRGGRAKRLKECTAIRPSPSPTLVLGGCRRQHHGWKAVGAKIEKGLEGVHGTCEHVHD